MLLAFDPGSRDNKLVQLADLKFFVHRAIQLGTRHLHLPLLICDHLNHKLRHHLLRY
jgi:hypothetical protein